jgi:Ni2+-binding GTPase involved in maturation of urease and hydrogenase
MEKLKLLLVGGFLGSGKTTAIEQAARRLQKANKKVGVITNDQGSLQVDTEFMKGQHIPTEEVSGGCFCCKYDDLERGIGLLLPSGSPDVVFAESVGTCTDLAATVINPLLRLNPGSYDIVLSVFADSRLLLEYLRGNRSIFYDNVNYIYEKQLREADIIVVNKIDLLTEFQLEWIKEQMTGGYRNTTILFQHSFSEESVGSWLTVCEAYNDPSLRKALDIDYDIYGAGEAELAWLDEEIGIVAPDGTAIEAAYAVMQKIYAAITANGYPIGHLKFLLDDGQGQTKVSFTAIAGADDDDKASPHCERVVIIVNARIQMAPAALQTLVRQTILEVEAGKDCRITEYNSSAFQPGYPRPTHRITN